MDCNIIPAVAARLKYYVEVQRKEAGFDLSGTQRDKTGNYRFYQHPVNYGPHRSQSIKKNFMDNRMEASLRLRVGKYGGERDRQLYINQERKQQVQKLLKKKMLSLTSSDHITSGIYLRRVNAKHRLQNEREGFSADLCQVSLPDISQEEFRRLISSASKLIVATTPEITQKGKWVSASCNQSKCPLCWSDNEKYFLPPLAMLPCRMETTLKTHGLLSQQFANRNTPSSLQESYCSMEPLTQEEAIQTDLDEAVDLGCQRNQTGPHISEKNEDATHYEITVHTGYNSDTDAKQVLSIILVGNNGTSEKLFLDKSSTNRVPFRKGQTDIFKVKDKDVGNLRDVIIGIERESTSGQKIKTKKEKRSSVIDRDAHDCEKASAQSLSEEGQLSSCAQDESVESAEKVDSDHLESGSSSESDTNHIKSSGSLITTELKTQALNKTAVRKHLTSSAAGSRKPSGCEVKPPCTTPPYKKRRHPIEKSGVSKIESHPLSTLGDQQCYRINEKATNEKSSSLDVNNNKIIQKITDTDREEQIQNQIQRDGLFAPEHRKASTPAGYVFFSHEMKEESPLFAESDGSSSRCNVNGTNKASKGESIITHNDTALETQSSPRASKGEGLADVSKLYLLQQILLEPISNSTPSSTGPDSQLTYSSLGKMEKADSRITTPDGSLGEDEIQGANISNTNTIGFIGSCCPLTGQTAQTSGYCRSCDGDQISYATDTTLEEEYLFSDTSLVLSLSENEESEDISLLSKSGSLGNQSENTYEEHEPRKDAMRIIPKKTDSSKDMSCIFQRALYVIKNKDNAKFRSLCQYNFLFPSSTDKEGKTLLHHAAAYGNTSICQMLLDTNVGKMNIDKQDIFGRTALHYAVQNDNSKTVKLLLDSGAKSEIPDENSKTVLDLALRQIQEM
ncbi:uncharacterized protein LOC142463382 isoform X4 [Ascaphus truei]|uniref:uncharacterized protein LOC142463382 isoform X4 n=1 Tax=Ascaphus truei TaxID=8439 RepID=UPI003F5A7758